MVMNEKCIQRCPVVANTREVLNGTEDSALKEAGKNLLGRLAAGCSPDGNGPLTMQAERDGVTYRVTLCASSDVPARVPGGPHEPSSISRKPSTGSR